jgi:hypothetical protein
MTTVKNELNSLLILAGTKKCNPDISTELLVTYENVASVCTDFQKAYTIDRIVHIPVTLYDDWLYLRPRDINRVIVDDYMQYCGNSNIRIDKYLQNAIDDGEFEAYLAGPFSCGTEDITKVIMYGWYLNIKRKKFGDPKACCSNGGNNYYNNTAVDAIGNYQSIKNFIVTVDDKKYTCSIDDVKMEETCDLYTGGAKIQCLYETRGIKKKCLPELTEYCLSSGSSILGEGVPRIIDYDTEKGAPKYPRCQYDFKRKYPDDYNESMDKVCNIYDNRDQVGIIYNRNNPLCIGYCINRTINDCEKKCYQDKVVSPEYINDRAILLSQICPPTAAEPNGNVDCLNNFENRVEKNDLDKQYKIQCTRECSNKIENKEIITCPKAQENYCMRADFDGNGKPISRVFTSQCQDIVSKAKTYGQYLEQYCMMDKKSLIYNEVGCENFRNEYNNCMLDIRASNDNDLLQPKCKNFWDKYKVISDIKFNDLCTENPFITKCSDRNFVDSTDFNEKGNTYAESLNVRFARTYNKTIDGQVREDNVLVDEYITNYCLDNFTKNINECTTHINNTLSKGDLVRYCATNDTFGKQKICGKLALQTTDEFEKYFYGNCTQTNGEFEACAVIAETCKNNKSICKKGETICNTEYNSCMNDYRQKCSDYEKCYNGMNQPDKRKECLQFKRNRAFYLTKECENVRRKRMIIIWIGSIIGIAFLILLIMGGIKIYLKYFKK